MKKLIGLITAAMLVLAFGLATCEAKPYKPQGISDYTVEIPDDAVIPDYVCRLEMMGTEPSEGLMPDGTRYYQMVNTYRDPDFAYFQDGIEEEQPAYIEVIKFEEGTPLPVHLVGIFFVNSQNKLEVYADRDCFHKPATDKLVKVTNPEFGKIGFKKVPRVNPVTSPH